MKGLSVIIAIALLMFADLLATRLKRANRLPADHQSRPGTLTNVANPTWGTNAYPEFPDRS